MWVISEPRANLLGKMAVINHEKRWDLVTLPLNNPSCGTASQGVMCMKLPDFLTAH